MTNKQPQQQYAIGMVGWRHQLPTAQCFRDPGC